MAGVAAIPSSEVASGSSLRSVDRQGEILAPSGVPLASVPWLNLGLVLSGTVPSPGSLALMEHLGAASHLSNTFLVSWSCSALFSLVYD